IYSAYKKLFKQDNLLVLSQGNNRLKEGNMWITLFKEKGVDLSKNILVTSTYNEKRNWCGMLADIYVITNVRNELTNNLGGTSFSTQ
ncbi:hypothetical protein KZ320_05230, partial [Glaesserella parasuis]|nr:hypothetical protein [Glaesserella parasuis]